MPVRVLVADENLDVQELVNDILLINLKDVAVDRALSAEGLRTRLASVEHSYSLIVAASTLVDSNGNSALRIIRREFPEYVSKTVALEDAHGEARAAAENADIPVLTKPFSLDEFGECITRICPH
jgi:DNA-binding NtrC family response regulator